MVLLKSSVIGSLVFWSSKRSSTKSECIESFKRISDYNSRCLESYSILPTMSSIWSIENSSTFILLLNWNSILYNSETVASFQYSDVYSALNECILNGVLQLWKFPSIELTQWTNSHTTEANWLFASWEKLVEIYTLCTRTSNCNWIDGLNSR